MKNIILFATLIGINMSLFGQTTAVDFTVNDCTGTSRNLFADLNAGKVVVLIWVMPCAACINAALTAQTEVQNARALNPGKIIYYLSDDVGNTNCTTLSSWAATNGVTDAIVISNANVNMAPYGDPGMPKVIVLGGSEHSVFYNQNEPAISAAGIRNGIISALAAPLGVKNFSGSDAGLNIYPNPSTSNPKISFTVLKSSTISIGIVNQMGEQVENIVYGDVKPGHFSFDLSTAELPGGIYFVNFSDGEKSSRTSFVVNH